MNRREFIAASVAVALSPMAVAKTTAVPVAHRGVLNFVENGRIWRRTISETVKFISLADLEREQSRLQLPDVPKGWKRIAGRVEVRPFELTIRWEITDEKFALSQADAAGQAAEPR